MKAVIKDLVQNNSYKLLSENSFKSILTNYYQLKTHSKLVLQTIITELVPNKSYILSSEI